MTRGAEFSPEQVVQKTAKVGGVELAWVPLAVESDEALNPTLVGPLGAWAVVARPQLEAQALEQAFTPGVVVSIHHRSSVVVRRRLRSLTCVAWGWVGRPSLVRGDAAQLGRELGLPPGSQRALQ